MVSVRMMFLCVDVYSVFFFPFFSVLDEKSDSISRFAISSTDYSNSQMSHNNRTAMTSATGATGTNQNSRNTNNLLSTPFTAGKQSPNVEDDTLMFSADHDYSSSLPFNATGVSLLSSTMNSLPDTFGDSLNHAGNNKFLSTIEIQKRADTYERKAKYDILNDPSDEEEDEDERDERVHRGRGPARGKGKGRHEDEEEQEEGQGRRHFSGGGDGDDDDVFNITNNTSNNSRNSQESGITNTNSIQNTTIDSPFKEFRRNSADTNNNSRNKRDPRHQQPSSASKHSIPNRYASEELDDHDDELEEMDDDIYESKRGTAGGRGDRDREVSRNTTPGALRERTMSHNTETNQMEILDTTLNDGASVHSLALSDSQNNMD
jgi:hypothetical protein